MTKLYGGFSFSKHWVSLKIATTSYIEHFVFILLFDIIIIKTALNIHSILIHALQVLVGL